MFKIDSTYTLLLIILIMVGFLYYKYDEKLSKERRDFDYDAIQLYLLNENEVDLEKSKKPIMWIHIVNDYNARMWESFGSRSSHHLNQPYMYLTIKSIISRCENDFHICLIDDNSFEKLIPEWDINMNIISTPILDNIRQLGLTKLLHRYGGILVPPSFLCMKNLIEMYEIGTRNGKMFVCETVDRNITSTTHQLYPNIHFMGTKKHNHTIVELIHVMENIISKDQTAQSIFLGNMNRWVKYKCDEGKIHLFDGKLIGTKSLDDDAILIDDLMNNSYIKLYSNTYGIYIPADEVLSRKNYAWFARLSPQQVLESKIIISKYILVANIPTKQGRIEAYEGEDEKEIQNNVKYWKVPLQAPVWGLMPNGLGDNVLQNKSGSANFNG